MPKFKKPECPGPAKLWDQAQNASSGASEADAEAGGTWGSSKTLSWQVPFFQMQRD